MKQTHSDRSYILFLLSFVFMFAYGIYDIGFGLSNAALSQNTTCSGHGTRVDVDGQATCLCESGYYMDGLSCLEDPCGSAGMCFYVDAENGTDSNAGTLAQPWRTIKKVESEIGSLSPGTYVLFRRGRSWGSMVIENARGAETQPITLGAYGPVAEQRPSVGKIKVYDSSYIVIRDFDARGIELRRQVHHSVLLDNVTHGTDNNSIGLQGGSHHNAIVGNFVYDIGSNDGITIHDHIDGRHYWFIDNTIIGNAGMEDGIDIASEGDMSDIKIYANRIQMRNTPGSAIYGTHKGHHVWVIGNTMMNAGIRLGSGDTRVFPFVQVSGNVVSGTNSGKWAMKSSFSDAVDEHNTLINTSEKRPLELRSPEKRSNILRNLFIATNADWFKGDSDQITSMDHNWFADLTAQGPISCIVNGMSLGEWRKETGFDLSTGCGAVPGIELPSSTWDDPRSWNDTQFWSHFVPDNSWTGCKGTGETPGAFDCRGQRQGMRIQPFAGYENGGYGWDGPLIVKQKYQLLSGSTPSFGSPPSPPQNLSVTSQ